MAEERTNFYASNGAAAYDLNRAPERRSLPDEQPRANRARRVKAKAAIAPFSVFSILAAACMMVLVVFGYVQLFEATSRVSKLESELATLTEQQQALQSKYESRIDLDDIETKAEALGFVRTSQDQIVYVNLSGTDGAEIYQKEHTNVISEVLNALGESVAELIAYLHPTAA